MNLLQVRLMLVLAPAACCLAGVAVHEVLKVLMRSIRSEKGGGSPEEARASPVPTKKGKTASKVGAQGR